ncbi:MAG: DUF2304 domain-containing protein [Candidatus Riflebacteria bacterium HGW-Riflebacteria-1]|jgi:hypothetical protein|nr:MAG: DUF2304 domain-containing protein [Candidatus Riflebacteria bacterium HGW-Riflebacteria-1]
MFEGIERIQMISIVGSLLFLAMITRLIKTKAIKEAYAILWLLFGTVFMIFSIWKKGLDYFATLVGVYYPPAMLFLILILALILVLIQFSIVISSQNDKIRKLCQELALLKLECSKTDITDENKKS